MSYDEYHARHCPQTCIETLVSYGKKAKLRVQGSLAMGSPFALKYFALLKRLGVPVISHRLGLVGRGRDIGRGRLCLDPVPNRGDALAKNCSLLGTVTYFPGRGFSVCCNNLALNRPDLDFIFAPDYRTLASSHFHRTLAATTFKDMLGRVDKGKQFFSYCDICEEYFTNGAE